MRVKPKIIVADDEIGALILITIILERAGYEIIKCRSGVDAATVLRKKENYPVMMIIDMMMPMMDGIELVEYVRGIPELLNIPLLMLSARNDNMSIRTALEKGATDYLVKPVLHHDLVAKVRKMLEVKPA